MISLAAKAAAVTLSGCLCIGDSLIVEAPGWLCATKVAKRGASVEWLAGEGSAAMAGTGADTVLVWAGTAALRQGATVNEVVLLYRLLLLDAERNVHPPRRIVLVAPTASVHQPALQKAARAVYEALRTTFPEREVVWAYRDGIGAYDGLHWLPETYEVFRGE